MFFEEPEIVLPGPDIYNMSTAIEWHQMSTNMKSVYVRSHMEEEFGKQRSLRITTTTFLSVVMIVGLPSNLMTIFIILFGKGPKTPTNYFLLNLTIVDFLVLAISKFFCKVYL